MAKEEKKESILKEVFGDCRICGLAGDKSTGKTNNLMALIKDFRDNNKETPIYVYGLNEITLKWIFQFKNVYEFSSLEQIANKKNSLIIIDEFQKLKLSDRRYSELVHQFVDFIYHQNNWCILSSPSLREFNSMIGGIIERWLLKSLKSSNLVNGSQIKDVVMSYNGRFKSINSIVTDPDTLLIINDEYEKYVQLPYIKQIDCKKENVNIFV